MNTQDTDPHRPPGPKEKGTWVAFRDKKIFLRPGDTYADLGGREYVLDQNGSLRRVKERKRHA